MQLKRDFGKVFWIANGQLKNENWMIICDARRWCQKAAQVIIMRINFT
jgi:hypothetical protein